MKKVVTIILIFCTFLSFTSYAKSSSYSNNTQYYKASDAVNDEQSTEDIINSQKSSLNIGDFLKQAENYTKDVFKDTDYNELLNSAIKGDIDNSKLGKSISDILGKEAVESIKTIGLIVIIIIIHSVLKSLTDGLENKSISQIVYYVQYILIVTVVLSSFADIITMLKNSIQDLVGFANALIPVLITLIISTGKVVSASIIQPILLFLVTFIGNFILNVIIPIVLVSTALGVVSKISDRIQLDKLSKFFKSSVVWILGVILTLFFTLVSIEGNLGQSVDAVTAKTAKAAVSNLIPIVGKILGDAVETVISCTNILKNAVGIVGVIVVIGICIMPIIKLVLIMTTYYIGSAICEPIADDKIVKLLGQMGDTFRVMLAILCSLSMMLIIGTTIVMKISGSA